MSKVTPNLRLLFVVALAPIVIIIILTHDFARVRVTESRVTPVSSVKNIKQTTFPDLISVSLANFYAAYLQQDALRLQSYFTPDNSGVAWNLTDYPKNYSVIGQQVIGPNWEITVQEQRSAGEVVRIFQFVPSGINTSGWLISGYRSLNSSGKYSGFVIE